MNTAKSLVSGTWRHFMHDSLYRNSIFIMLNNVILAAFGFLFWIIAAHFYSPQNVGIGTTFIAVSSILVQAATLGFNVSIIKFLPKSQRKAEEINTSLVTVSVASIIASIIFVLGVRIFSPKLGFIAHRPWMWFGFIIFTVVATLFQILNTIFIAVRSAGYGAVSSLVFSLAKLFLVGAFAYLAGFGIFVSVSIATLGAVIYSLYVLGHKFRFRLRPKLHYDLLRHMAGFSFSNYFLSFFNNLYLMILPVVITNKVGPSTSAYFYIATSLITFLYVVPQAAASSMFAEGAHDKYDRKLIMKSAKMLFALLLPAILVYILAGKYILLIYGHSYSANGGTLLAILAVGSIFASISQLYFTHYRVSNQMWKLNFIVFFTNVLAVALSYLFVRHGLVIVGLIIGGCQILSSLLFFVLDSKGPLWTPRLLSA